MTAAALPSRRTSPTLALVKPNATLLDPEDGLVALAAAGAADIAQLSRLLDQLGLAFCLYDGADRVTAWNDTYLAFFPEQDGTVTVGMPYADTLRRFFRTNLPESELVRLDEHVEAAVARHLTQEQPFVFQMRSGRWVKVASLPLAGHGRIRIWRDVTPEQTGQAQGRAGRETARALAALDTAYAVFDRAGTFVTANKRYLDLFPALGKRMSAPARLADHLRTIAAEVVVPAAAARLEGLAERPLPEALPVRLPLLLERRDGGWLRFEERLGEEGGVVALWTDATREAEADARIRSLERHLHDAVEAMPQALVMFDGNGWRVLSNGRLAAIAPALAEALETEPTLSRLTAWRESAARAGREAGRQQEPDELALADGRTLRFETATTSASETLVLIDDVTREREAEHELGRQREIAHQNEKLAALGSLLAGVAHELNNPLSVVVARAALLEEALGQSPQGDAVRTLKGAAERCAGIVRTFLAVARAKPQEKDVVSVPAVIDAVFDMVAYGFRTADIALERGEIAPDAAVEVEPERLHQVLLNLLVNAQHALRDAPRPRQARASARVADGRVEIMVDDNGPGVPASIRRRIFEPYFTTKPVGVGTGIGLSVCHGIIAAHGGTITIDDAPGGGARFTITLPHARRGEARAEGKDRVEAPSGRLKVLVVDDEPDITDVLAEVLARDGHDVATAAEGEAALVALAGRTCDVLITDLRMPGLDGAGLLRRLAEVPAAERPAVIVLTGDALSLRRDAALIEPPPSIVEKPFDPVRLAAEVRRLGVARRRAMGG
ncbi:hybrid sensor histidine kinase/response regulator [Elioraea rosea]|uniref:hybrid sensor histidine kinase/response regulator n=1 Tax=Elioraea rosea TaxID=2492390 RepID=UPI0013150FAF|nr:PAS-domain containing protein [Elioraea rosea]